MNVFRTTSRRALFGAALVSAVYVPSVALSSDETAQLPQGDPARKIAVLHWQEVHLEDMVASACYAKAGVNAEANRAAAYAARDAFEATLPDIIAEVDTLDPSNSAVRHLKRKLSQKKDQWYRFRVVLEGGLKAENAGAKELGELALMEVGLVEGIEDVYRAVKRKAAKMGTVNLADDIAESAGFSRVFASSRLMKTACLVSAGAGDAFDRQKLAAALDTMEKQLDVDETLLITKAEVRELVPAWREMMPRLRAALEAGKPDDALLAELETLAEAWKKASGVPGIGVEQS
ncbi:MAG: hypothetical protein AAF968_14065 [Pseudomonadota bacterium]